jgi:hypothetical protein
MTKSNASSASKPAIGDSQVAPADLDDIAPPINPPDDIPDENTVAEMQKCDNAKHKAALTPKALQLLSFDELKKHLEHEVAVLRADNRVMKIRLEELAPKFASLKSTAWKDKGMSLAATLLMVAGSTLLGCAGVITENTAKILLMGLGIAFAGSGAFTLVFCHIWGPWTS